MSKDRGKRWGSPDLSM